MEDFSGGVLRDDGNENGGLHGIIKWIVTDSLNGFY